MKICPRCSELYPDDVARCPKDSESLRAVLDPLIGRTVGGRYRLISRIGSGGMSSVYLARHVMIDRLMAIKTLRRDLAQDPVQRDRFMREARAVNRINHENIVEITDVGETNDGLVFLVMEYVPGDPLLTAMEEGPMPLGRAFAIVRQCAAALGRAHQMEVVHRDLKPENVLLVPQKDGSDFVKVLDFGIAKILDAPSLTGSQQIFGTPGYIAPEYIKSTEIDGRADLYSLGVMLYEMVTGALPFDYEYPGDLLIKHVSEEPVRPSVRFPAINEGVEAFILRCLRKDPDRRFRDAHHFLEELQTLMERLGPELAWGDMDGGTGSARGEDDWDTEEMVRHWDIETHPASTWELETSPDSVHWDQKTTPDLGTHTPSELPSDPTQVDRSLRPQTQDYARPSIPDPPAIDAIVVPVRVDVASRGQGRSSTPLDPKGPRPFDPERDGIGGVWRWRLRFDSIRACIDEVEQHSPAPPQTVQSMAQAARVLEEFEECARAAVENQERVEELNGKAREVRSTLGRAIDSLAGKLSKARGELEALALRRNALRDSKESVRARRKAGRATEGDVDAVVWQYAAAEASVRAEAASCDELEHSLAQLRIQLEEKSGAIESEVESLSNGLADEMARIETMSAELRHPLEEAERFVREKWRDLPKDAKARLSAPG